MYITEMFLKMKFSATHRAPDTIELQELINLRVRYDLFCIIRYLPSNAYTVTFHI